MPASVLESAIIGDWDPADRLRDQARDGVSAEVIFPTFALQACFASRGRASSSARCAARTTAGRPRCSTTRGCWRSGWWRCSTSTAPSRTPSASPSRASARCSSRACPQREYNDAEYDRFWAVAQDLGLPLTFHSGTGHEPRVVRGPGGAVMNYLLGSQLDGPMVMLGMAAGGALDRFPGLQLVTVETGAAWLAWIMTQADAIYTDHAMYAKPKLSMKPSELIRRQCAATFMYDPVAINNRGTTGVETLMWGNDYPHPEGTWPSSQDVARDQFDGVPDDEVQRDRRRQRRQGVRLRPRPRLVWRRIPDAVVRRFDAKAGGVRSSARTTARAGRGGRSARRSRRTPAGCGRRRR